MNRPAGLAGAQAARLLLGGHFFVPYLVLYASTVDISLSMLLAVEAFLASLVVLFGAPGGRLAGRIGPRQALVAGALLRGGGAAALGLAPSATMFWAVQPLFAAATVLTTGADTALVAGLLRRAGRAADLGASEQAFQSQRLTATALVLTAASALSLAGMRWTFLATALAQLAAAVILVRVPDIRSPSGVDRLSRSHGLARGSPAPLLAMVLAGTAFTMLLYLTPVYLVRAGFGESLVGVAAAGVVLAAVALPERWSPRVCVALAAVAALAFGTTWAALVLAAAVVTQAAQSRLAAGVVDEHAVATGRNLGFAVLAPCAGVLAAWTGPVGVAVLCAALLAVAGVACPPGRQPRAPRNVPVTSTAAEEDVPSFTKVAKAMSSR